MFHTKPNDYATTLVTNALLSFKNAMVKGPQASDITTYKANENLKEDRVYTALDKGLPSFYKGTTLNNLTKIDTCAQEALIAKKKSILKVNHFLTALKKVVKYFSMFSEPSDEHLNKLVENNNLQQLLNIFEQLLVFLRCNNELILSSSIENPYYETQLKSSYASLIKAS